MSGKKWRTVFALLVVGGLLGVGAMVAGNAARRQTSTDAFCISCHTMAIVAADPHFKQAAHETNAFGLHVDCVECHIPPGNWFTETYAHTSIAIRDVIAEYTQNYSDPTVWQKRRMQLAVEIQEAMRRSDSPNCRKCHDAASIQPTSETGRSAHAQLQKGGVTCIDCHVNVVHAPPTTGTSIVGPGQTAQTK